jgi:hypothetical protein
LVSKDDSGYKPYTVQGIQMPSIQMPSGTGKKFTYLCTDQ